MLKKTLLIVLLLPLLSFQNSTESISETQGKVYICTGKYAKAYHNRTTCKGMKACKGEIKIITLKRAKELNRHPCGYCYK